MILTSFYTTLNTQFRIKIAFLFVLLFAFNFLLAKDNSFRTAKKGLIDLRTTDFNLKNQSLEGEWEFYWNELRTEESASPKQIAYIHFPSLWNETIHNHKELQGTGYATYKLKVLFSGNNQDLAIQIPDTYSAYKLFINGKIVSKNGEVGKNKETSVPHWLNKTIELPNNIDTINLLLQVSNFHHSKGGTMHNLIIGKRDVLMINHNKQLGSDFIIAGCMIMSGLFFLALFLFKRQDKSILFFALFSIFYSFRIVGSGYYSLHSVLPDLNWSLTIHLEYLSLFLSVLTFTLYTRYLYPNEIHKPIINSIFVICVVFALITAITSPLYFTQTIPIFLSGMFIYLSYTFYVYVQAVKNNRQNAKFSIIGLLILLGVFTTISINYFGLIDPNKIYVFAGYILFFSVQSIILFYRFTDTLEQAKKSAEQVSQAKSDFLSTMSHEIRTPLNSVVGMTHLLIRNNPRSDQKEQLSLMLFSANNLLSVVNDILDFNKIESGKINFEEIETNLRELAKNTVAVLKTQSDDKGIALLLEIDEDLQNTVISDPTRIGQVLTNLVHNAIKFTEEGEVKLKLELLNCNHEYLTIRFSIKDTGIGISKDKQKIIFERFVQADSSTSRSYGGTGLGLAICKRILQEQNSELEINSEVGVGTEFYFEQKFRVFGIIKEEVKTVENEIIHLSIKPLIGIEVLLVEDNEMNILVAQKFLENWGAVTEVARNGQEALDMLDVNRHLIVLMDMHMPIMDGYEATRAMRNNKVTLPIVALTASIPGEIRNKVFHAGASDIILKPFDPNTLCRMILHYTKTVQLSELEELMAD